MGETQPASPEACRTAILDTMQGVRVGLEEKYADRLSGPFVGLAGNAVADNRVLGQWLLQKVPGGGALRFNNSGAEAAGMDESAEKHEVALNILDGQVPELTNMWGTTDNTRPFTPDDVDWINRMSQADLVTDQ